MCRWFVLLYNFKTKSHELRELVDINFKLILLLQLNTIQVLSIRFRSVRQQYFFRCYKLPNLKRDISSCCNVFFNLLVCLVNCISLCGLYCCCMPNMICELGEVASKMRDWFSYLMLVVCVSTSHSPTSNIAKAHTASIKKTPWENSYVTMPVTFPCFSTIKCKGTQ